MHLIFEIMMRFVCALNHLQVKRVTINCLCVRACFVQAKKQQKPKKYGMACGMGMAVHTALVGLPDAREEPSMPPTRLENEVTNNFRVYFIYFPFLFHFWIDSSESRKDKDSR